jgi:RNA recognition motif-containing protein
VNSKLYIRNLSYSITENELRTLFAMSGTVVLVDIIKDRLTKHSKGYGFIQMSSPVEAENAVEKFDGWSMDSCTLRVGLTQNRERLGSFQNLGITVHGALHRITVIHTLGKPRLLSLTTST